MKKIPMFLLLTACIQARALPVEEVDYAKKQATAFADDLGYKVLGVSCATNDSDNDGYTTCTARVAPESRIVLDCAYDKDSAIGRRSGCKEKTLRARAVEQSQ